MITTTIINSINVNPRVVFMIYYLRDIRTRCVRFIVPCRGHVHTPCHPRGMFRMRRAA
jgi:hypothetical protein